jgi:guanylate cyclase
MALLSMPLIGTLAAVFAIGGHVEPVIWCVGYIALTALLCLAVMATGRFAILRIPHVFAVGMLPFGLTCWLGGFTASGGAMLWTLLVPIAATMFGFARVWLWFLGVTVLAVIGFFSYAPSRAVLSGRELEFHFMFNTIGFTGFLFMSVRHFVQRIDEEKTRVNELLLRVLPAPIVRRLKRGQTVIADHLSSVTVVFADIVGFTPLAARLSAGEVVALLDEVFTTFDELARKYGVSKIKTIGDAYMAVAGAPEPAVDHAARAARLALAMRDHVRELAAARKIELAMRIGVHTGEVVAGVIGIERFAYDLWGDTVNTASRMESHGQPNRVQITSATKDALTGFAITERGPIEVKGRGTITTYWLD